VSPDAQTAALVILAFLAGVGVRPAAGKLRDAWLSFRAGLPL